MITSSQIKTYLSGGAANADPNASLGGAISSTEVVDNSLHNLFDRVLGSEATAGDTEYRCVYVKNTHPTLTYLGAKVYISANTTSTDSSATIALATEVGSPVQTIANENTAPSGEVFSTADGLANALSIGDLAAGEVKALWIKWVIDAEAPAFAADTLALAYDGDTEA